MCSSGSSDDVAAVAARSAKKRARRKRELKPKKPKIRTYIRRRTEIEELMHEMEKLEKQMKHYEQRNAMLKQRNALTEKEMLNKTMRDALHGQRLSFASTLSMVTQFFRNTATEPFDLPARLSSDPLERQTALLRMKHDRLQVGHHFMLQRCHRLSATEFCDRKKFEAANGDLVSQRFEVLPLPGARSVKAIIDALQFFVYNIEISISEAVGDINIRENDDAKPGSPVAQHRLVATVGGVIQTDTNNVAFADYRPAGPPGSGEHELGLMICDSVDEDELYPYQPDTRVRQDMTQITQVTWQQQESGEPMIVMTRWWCLRIRKSDIYVPPFVVERIRTGVDKVGAAISTEATSMSVSPTRTASGSFSDGDADADSVPKSLRPSKKRLRAPKPTKPKIRTYIRRRTEINELQDEMEHLKKKLIQYETRNQILKQQETLAEREMTNKVMRDALHAQRLSFASTASMLTQFYRDNVTEPFDLPAILGRDPVEREASLLRMKNDRLEVARHFMRQREHYRMTSEFCDRKKFEATNGDFVSLRFEIVPLTGASSIKSIIDALQDFVYNLEISISEAIGDISVRENDDAIPGSQVAQHRLVATVANHVQTDTNTVAFAEYQPASNGERELGLMIGDAVDEDELYPYHSESRVRQDMTVITSVAWHEGEQEEPMIVMTRWWCLRLRKSHIDVPPFVVDRICTGVEKVAEAMLLTARRAGGLR
ncbi:hypothetical protein P3T76_014895 [Phytophthora citrophthora]|uniref:Uncharacterized protein n=1 Tax=Phytophthora citrophthora TaxID=4793 RepID=A0AAD9LAT1_9STRA|nr:hypothetical protein P3T76_014895 [Phytophthora citrophthora]